ncbi:hypothetical protein QBC34DRAFT_139243 [Podospora aff. communis PSN243]|uniref:Uncharacterized protein n=1 Tax=Podospora aff. communis PSN243 TaxID=3040156 RepID=A0AAV9H576_9PEZI|nr:hypothetical protein QBC34DRAFT_139243 [Podospora aff. communis PSN243]
MGHHGFTQLPSLPNESWMAPATRRRRPFSRVELCLLIPLIVFAALLAVFTIIYLIRHRGTVKPVAIAALCCTSLLLLGVGYIVSRRLQRPEWHRDVEAGPFQKLQISAPLPASPVTKQTTFDSKGFYAAISESRPSTPGQSTLSGKVRLAMKRTFNPGLLSQSSVESLQGRREDRVAHIRQPADGESRSSSDSSGDEAGEGLWRSVFELAGDARLEQLRQANHKRLSRESRHSRYEMSGWARESNGVEIIVTKPQPTASGASGRGTSLADARSQREISLAFDPLRANPVQLTRDTSMRQTKSSHDLPSLLRSTDRTTPSLRRPRSAEPRPGCEDRSVPLIGGKSNQLLPVAPSLPASRVSPARPRIPASGGPRGLRRLPNPSDHDLREVFKTRDGALR